MAKAPDSTTPSADAGPVKEELDAALEVMTRVVQDAPWVGSLFLTGSAVTGEWAAQHSESGWCFFSDIDVGIVCDERELGREQALRQAIVNALDAFGQSRDWQAAPQVNIAFFTRPELRTQAPKPGTLEMINQAMVLVGDRSIRDHFPPLTVEDLTWEQSVRLLGNRVLELLSHPPGEEIQLLDYFRLAKFFCDVPTALLIPEAAYVSGYRQRANRLPSLLNDRALPPKLHRRKGALIESVEFWTEFRYNPNAEVLRERHHTEPLGEEGRALHSGLWCEARLTLEACLESLLPHRLLSADGRPEPSALGRTSGWGTLRERMREWRWLASYSGEAAPQVWRRGARVAFRLSPVEITYLIGFILFLRGVDGPPPCYLDDDLVRSLERWYPLPHERWETGEDVRNGLIRLWRYWLPRI
jgi:hypothetical protein